MAKKKITLVTDLDGTFLKNNLEMNTSCILYDFIHKFRDEIILVYATGRGYESIVPLISHPILPSPDYIIADVGATVLKKNERSYESVISIQSNIEKNWPGREYVLSLIQEHTNIKLQNVPQERRCSFTFDDPKELKKALKIFQNENLDVMVSAGKYLDILPSGVSKGNALLQLVEIENFAKDTILVAGDTLNDLSLIETGFKAVIVGGAEDALKKIADGNPQIYLAEKSGPDGVWEGAKYHNFVSDVDNNECDKAEYGFAELVMVYHRQPLEEFKVGKKTVRQEPKSPNGIIPTLLDFFSSGKKGAWVAWSQQDSRNPIGFESNVFVNKDKYPNLLNALIPLTQSDVQSFYKVFSKEAFWPIIFSFPERAIFSEPHWHHFCEINKLFAIKTAEVAAKGATIWIHDYNLWMVPAYLRQLRPDLKISFFHHTAFPTSNIFNILPWRREIVTSLLNCNYVGFHIPRYVENFVDIVKSTLPTKVLASDPASPNYLSYGCALGSDTIVRQIETPLGILGLGAHPVGINLEKIEEITNSQTYLEKVEELREEAKNRKIILSVERLDYVKGPIEKMLAYESFLEQHTEFHEKVVMINIVTPPAPGMEVYKTTREKLDQVVGRINGRFSKLGWTPVRYFYRSIPFSELISYYAIADVAWITPLRDGLNLVAKEFVAAKQFSQTQGVLVLSEFAGAAVEMMGVLLTNPYDKKNLIEVLVKALLMDESEIVFRQNRMFKRVKFYDVKKWGKDYLDAAHGI